MRQDTESERLRRMRVRDGGGGEGVSGSKVGKWADAVKVGIGFSKLKPNCMRARAFRVALC